MRRGIARSIRNEADNQETAVSLMQAQPRPHHVGHHVGLLMMWPVSHTGNGHQGPVLFQLFKVLLRANASSAVSLSP